MKPLDDAGNLVGCDKSISSQPTLLMSIIGVIQAATLLLSKVTKRRQPNKASYRRKAWDDFIATELNIPLFELERTLRMPYPSFLKLVELLPPALEVNAAQANRRGGAIIPEYCVYMTLRYLAGRSYLDIKVFVKVSRAAFYACIEKTLKAIWAMLRWGVLLPCPA